MPQAIICHYLACTRTKPARIVTQGSGPGAPRLIESFHMDGQGCGYERYRRAAERYAQKFGWGGKWHAQELPGSWVFVAIASQSAFVTKAGRPL